MATMRIDVVSAEEAIYSGDAEFVVLPGIMGELGIYPRHAPLITQIKAGTVRIKVPGKEEEEMVYVQGGFLEVQPDHVNVLSDTAIRAADLDEADATLRRVAAWYAEGLQADIRTARARLDAARAMAQKAREENAAPEARLAALEAAAAPAPKTPRAASKKT